jgi:hypothetical protein
VSLIGSRPGAGNLDVCGQPALASAVGISWTSELLTATGLDPAGPVSVQPNSLVTWGSRRHHPRETTQFREAARAEVLPTHHGGIGSCAQGPQRTHGGALSDELEWASSDTKPRRCVAAQRSSRRPRMGCHDDGVGVNQAALKLVGE